MQNAPWGHSAILSTFIKLSFVIKIFVLSIFEWPFYTDFTVVWILYIFKSLCHWSDHLKKVIKINSYNLIL